VTSEIKALPLKLCEVPDLGGALLFAIKTKTFKPGTLVHACNPSYLDRLRQEDDKFEANLVHISETWSQKQKKVEK
jgi:hypothetical protein